MESDGLFWSDVRSGCVVRLGCSRGGSVSPFARFCGVKSGRVLMGTENRV